MAEVRVTLPLPPGVNAMWRTWRGRMLLSREGRAFRLSAQLAAKGCGLKPLSGPVALEIFVYRRRRAGDLDGFLKGVLDALNGIAYSDDSQVVEITAHRLDDKHRPRVEVEIWAAEEEAT